MRERPAGGGALHLLCSETRAAAVAGTTRTPPADRPRRHGTSRGAVARQRPMSLAAGRQCRRRLPRRMHQRTAVPRQGCVPDTRGGPQGPSPPIRTAPAVRDACSPRRRRTCPTRTCPVAPCPRAKALPLRREGLFRAPRRRTRRTGRPARDPRHAAFRRAASGRDRGAGRPAGPKRVSERGPACPVPSLLPAGEGGRRSDEGACPSAGQEEGKNPHPNPLPKGEGTWQGNSLAQQLSCAGRGDMAGQLSRAGRGDMAPRSPAGEGTWQGSPFPTWDRAVVGRRNGNRADPVVKMAWLPNTCPACPARARGAAARGAAARGAAPNRELRDGRSAPCSHPACRCLP